MSSLRKKVSSYFRQLSFHNEPRIKRTFINENTFINKYLCGQIKLREGAPPVLHGKTPNDLPNFEIDDYETGAAVIGCSTGPNGGLTTVQRIEKHLCIPDADIDYIDDKQDDIEKITNRVATTTTTTTTMKIKVAGQTYIVANKRKSLSLNSLHEIHDVKEPIENQQNNNIDAAATATATATAAALLSKSKSSTGMGKVLRLTQRPGQQLASSNEGQKWGLQSDLAFGLSDSLYDTNQITKEKNGNPIADCFGIIARQDSAILALADGVNWGEKSCIAAKSAIHGSMHYINKTVFNDVSLFDPPETSKGGTSQSPDNKISNTNDIFVCLLRAFNSAHNLILENNGMLTTLTILTVLPLKKTNLKGGKKFICCCCNLGDTFAYIYSPKFGVREMTKGSHDVSSNRDMRDALGALGPVDGQKPELNNLTLSVTTLDVGDLVFIASDGLTDNFDPSVCKFTVNQEGSTKKNPPQPTIKQKDRKKITASNVSRLALTKTKPPEKPPEKTTKKCDEVDYSSPYVKQFMQENPLSKSSSTSRVTKGGAGGAAPPQPPKMSFMRSKTSIDLSRKPPEIPRNENGLPYVTPLQRYELTLLLMEDILIRGLTGRDLPCVTAKTLCENLLRYTISITAAKRRTLEDKNLYYDVKNDIQVELNSREKKLRRRRCLEQIQNLPGKLDHVSVVAYNVGNRVYEQEPPKSEV